MLHYVVGSVVLLVFLMTGVFMDATFPDIYRATEAIRYQFRANHIYILMSALLNFMAALLPSPAPDRWRQVVSRLGSLSLMLAPLLLIPAFFIEPPRGISERVLTVFGVVMLVLGVVLCVVARVTRKSRREDVSR